MLTRIQLTAILLLAFAVVAGVTSLHGTGITFGPLFGALSGSVTALMLALVLFDVWLWRASFLYPWFVARPYIGGEWEGEIHSLWKDPETGNRPAAIPVKMSVYQTFSELQLMVTTPESRSEVLLANIKYNASGAHSMGAVYLNTPRLEVRHRSPIHRGALVMSARGRRPAELTGDYWTDRESMGELRLRRVGAARQGQALESRELDSLRQ